MFRDQNGLLTEISRDRNARTETVGSKTLTSTYMCACERARINLLIFLRDFGIAFYNINFTSELYF